jgi:hypothetical protein
MKGYEDELLDAEVKSAADPRALVEDVAAKS